MPLTSYKRGANFGASHLRLIVPGFCYDHSHTIRRRVDTLEIQRGGVNWAVTLAWAAEQVVAGAGGLAWGAATVHRRPVPTLGRENTHFLWHWLVSRRMATPRDSSQQGYARGLGVGPCTQTRYADEFRNLTFIVNRTQPYIHRRENSYVESGVQILWRSHIGMQDRSIGTFCS
jgi:hypothetical protein